MIVIIGSGAAGISAAITCAQAGKQVALFTKGAIEDTNTCKAQGGIAAAIFPGTARTRTPKTP